MLTWTEQRPSKPGWYWMLYPAEAPGIPIVTQIVIDTSGSPPALCVLVPAAKPKADAKPAEDIQLKKAIEILQDKAQAAKVG